MSDDSLENFAARYAKAWSSQDPASVAAFYSPGGSLSINDGEPSVGHDMITVAAQAFMTALPDMVVSLDRLERSGDAVDFHWTLDGANTGPGGTGNRVRISGYERWTIGSDGLIESSDGTYDAADYQRQIDGE